MLKYHLTGLTNEEVKQLYKKFGTNEIPDDKKFLWYRIFVKFWSPVPWMLEVAVLLQLLLHEYVAASVIAVLLLVNAALGFFNESRAQSTLNSLKSRLALITLVLREGIWTQIPARELVPGDIIRLFLGCIVGADAKLIEGDILLDHSMLTGESLPVEGNPGFQTYAGAVVRCGEAIAEVTATGIHTRFGRTAELVRTAHTISSQQKSVLQVVRNLAICNSGVVLIQAIYALLIGMQPLEIVPLILTAILAAIPVALPATFTLATAIGARALGRIDVLPTRLSAVDEAAMMDVLCADKTGTLTQNVLKVTAVYALPGFNESYVLALATLACSDEGQDPVDTAIRSATQDRIFSGLPQLIKFIPFDPATKIAKAVALDTTGQEIHILKGAFAKINELATVPASAMGKEQSLEAQGYRVLAVAAGYEGALQIIGLIALGDPPRSDAAQLISQLEAMNVHTVMLTGDSSSTARVVANAVGLEGAVCPIDKLTDENSLNECAIFAGILPEDKFNIVKALQRNGHIVGMCGDGVNDAPALRQAQIGIAMSTATDAAKSAAGIVLTKPGLAGIVATVHEGRIAFQRIFTYTLRSITRKIDQVLFLTVGLIMTGHAILTPILMVILMLTGDLLALSATTDNVRPSPKPNNWQINSLTIAGIILGICNLIFCSSILAVGYFHLRLATPPLQTLAAITMVFCGQVFVYVARERRWIWSSRPGGLVILSSVVDIAIILYMATQGILMTALPLLLISAVMAAAIIYAFILDAVKVMVFARLKIAY